MRLHFLAAAFVLGSGSPAFAATPEAPSANAAQPAKAPAQKTRKICRREDKTGSVVPKRVCRTVVVDEAPKPAEVAAPAEPTRAAS